MEIKAKMTDGTTATFEVAYRYTTRKDHTGFSLEPLDREFIDEGMHYSHLVAFTNHEIYGGLEFEYGVADEFTGEFQDPKALLDELLEMDGIEDMTDEFTAWMQSIEEE